MFAQVSTYESSPFGAHPAEPYFEANNLGVKWNRGIYFSWGMIDPTNGEIFKIAIRTVQNRTTAVLLKNNPVVIEENY